MLVTGILQNSLSNSYKYGITKHGTTLYLFKPFKKEYPNLIVGCSKNRTYSNLLVVVDYIKESNKANIVHILGECGNWEAETRAILWNYCPYYYKKSKETYVLKLNQEATPLEWDTFNIDPEGCLDIDDCISWKVENDVLSIGVTISDVSFLFESFPDLQLEAFKRGQTIYSEKENRGMLPIEYEELCSLLPGRHRNGITLFFEVINNQILNLRFQETIIKNDRSYTYENVSMNDRLKKFLILYSNSDDSHKWIESLMLLYNKTAADLLYKNKVGVFRRQKMREDVESVYQKYCPFLLYETAEYCDVSEEDLTHFALNIERYCHITSPIRRFSDSFNQQKIKNILKTGSPLSVFRQNNQVFSKLFDENNQKCFKEMIEEKDKTSFYLALNKRSSEARKHDRDLFFLKKIRENTEKEIEGVIVDLDEKWVQVFIFDWNRIIKFLNQQSFENLKIEQKIKLRYFYNCNEFKWKNRIIYEVIN